MALKSKQSTHTPSRQGAVALLRASDVQATLLPQLRKPSSRAWRSLDDRSPVSKPPRSCVRRLRGLWRRRVYLSTEMPPPPPQKKAPVHQTTGCRGFSGSHLSARRAPLPPSTPAQGHCERCGFARRDSQGIERARFQNPIAAIP